MNMQKRNRTKRAPEPETVTAAANAQELFKRGRRIITELAGTLHPAAEPPQLAGPDLLRTEIYNLTPEQEESARAELLVAIVKSLTGMTASRLQRVAQFIEICENDHGTITPAEEFITGLVMVHSSCGLTPAYAADQLAEFRNNFGDTIDITSQFTARYSELIRTQCEGTSAK
jgi:hypothetical protein